MYLIEYTIASMKTYYTENVPLAQKVFTSILSVDTFVTVIKNLIV